MVYTVSSLKNAASFLKKQGLIPKSTAVTKLKKPELESLVKRAGYDMSELKSFKKSKTKVSGRPRKNKNGPKTMTYKDLYKHCLEEGKKQLQEAMMSMKPKRGRKPKSTTAAPAQVVAGQRRPRKQRSDKGKKRGPRGG